MEKEQVCVFCGEKPGAFRSTQVECAGTLQFACKTCEKELRDLDVVEVCRRALLRRLAKNPEILEKRIVFINEAEEHRLTCLRCGTKLRFCDEETLDTSPYGDSMLTESLDVIPALCENCGKIEFFNPQFIKKNKHLAYLIYKDTHLEG